MSTDKKTANTNEISNGSERRRFTRVGFDAATHITQNDLSLEAHLVDISLSGLLVETPNNYQLRSDQTAQVQIRLSDDVEINMIASLVHSSDHVLGFHCESIDMDSVTHLRRLVELNIGEDGASDRELSQLLHETNV